MLLFYLSLLEEDERDDFARAYHNNYLKMYHVALGMLKHKEDAENAVHDAFVSLATNFKKYRELDDERMMSLCNVIVRNKGLDILRKRTSHGECELENFAEAASKDNVEELILSHEQHDEVVHILEGLDEEAKLVLILKYFHDYKNGEIAKILNISKRAVEMRLHRAKQKIREEVKEL